MTHTPMSHAFFISDKLATRYLLQAYNRRLLRRNVEQSRAIRYPDSGSEIEENLNLKKPRREKPRKHKRPERRQGNQVHV